jgi:hypothetical protein
MPFGQDYIDPLEYDTAPLAEVAAAISIRDQRIVISSLSLSRASGPTWLACSAAVYRGSFGLGTPMMMMMRGTLPINWKA